MRYINPGLLLLSVIAATGCVASEQPPFEAALKQPIDAIAEPYIASGEIVGMSVGVIRGGRISTFHYGLTEANGTTPDNHTHYEIGSVTKTMTGLLLADGVVRGRYKLDTPVSELVPEAAGLDRRVTLQRLSTHTSGLPRLPSNLFPLDPVDPYAKYDEDHLFAWLAKPEMAYEPDTQAVYSNLAVGLLGYAMGQDAGCDYAALLTSQVLKPLSMDDSGIALAPKQLAKMARPHRADAAPDHLWDLNVLAGAGAVRSTLSDMLKYLHAQLDPEATALHEAIEMSQRRHTEPGGASLSEGTSMGLGWVIEDRTGWRCHNGQTGGYFSEFWFNRDQQIGFVVLSNTSTTRVSQFASALRGVLQ